MNKYLEKLLIVVIILGAVLLGFYLGTTRQQQQPVKEANERPVEVNAEDATIPTANISVEPKTEQPKSVSGGVKKTEPKKEEASPILQPPALPD